MDKDAQSKIQQLQLLEQNMQNFLMQKQQLQQQLMEIESALEELDKTKKAYKIIGNIMVASESDELKTDLTQKKDTLNLRLKSIQKQEDKLKEKSQALQSEVLTSMKEGE